MSLAERVGSAFAQVGAVGVIAGVSVAGVRETAAVGLADGASGRRLTATMTVPVASVTKPVVATAAVRLWQRRGVALDTPLVELLPALAADWRASRRLALPHLLSHTSGLRADLDPGEAASYEPAADALEQAVRATVRRGQVYRLGANWQYGNAGYALAGYALGVLAAATFEDALRAELLAPLAMANTGFGPAEVVGHTAGRPVRETYWRARRPGGGLTSTVDDVLAFAESVLADPDLLAAMSAPGTPNRLGACHGLGWNLSHRGRVRWHFGDWGGCHSALLLDPVTRTAVTVVTNDDAALDLRRDLAWAEFTRLTGLRGPRLMPAIRTAQALTRTAVATVTRPRNPESTGTVTP